MTSQFRLVIAGVLGVAGLASVSVAQLPPSKLPEKMSYLDNGIVRLGVDLNRGGTIAYLSESKGRPNLINAYDLGREVQQAYYSGPLNPKRRDVPYSMWNPTAGGGVRNNPSPVLAHRNDGRELYVQDAPQNWEPNGIPGECVTETWIRLSENTARVRHRLIAHRSDRTQYPAETQELPALYVNGPYSHTFTYDGQQPFQKAPLREIAEIYRPSGSHWSATEFWSAMVDREGWGLGIFQPGVIGYGGRFYGTPDAGGTYDVATNTLSPRGKEVLDHNITYEFEYVLIVGTLLDIRSYAYEHRPRDTRPDDVFERDRRHWWFVNAADSGFPIQGRLRVSLDREDPQMIGPEGWWRAEDAPKLTIRAAYHLEANAPTNVFGQVFYRVPGQANYSEDRSVRFTIVPDGLSHSYEVDLASSPGYRGPILGLRFDPLMAASPQGYVDVFSISHRKRN